MDDPSKTMIISRKRIYAVFILLCLLVFAVYSNTFRATWHLDDYQNIQTNSRLHINDLRPETLWKTFFAHPTKGGRLYRPVPCLSLALNWYFGKDDVFGYHLVNISIHLVTAFFLFLTILNLFKSPNLKDRYPGKEYFIALLAAVLWAVNPIQTQAVTYIVQRMASMAAMFYLIGIYFYVKGKNTHIRAHQFWFFAGCLASFIFALASKQNAATLPIALVLVEITFFRDLGNPKVRKIFLPILIGSGLFVVFLGILLFKHNNPLFFLQGCGARLFTPLERVMTESRIVLFYLSQIFYPVPTRLSIEHDVVISTSLIEPWTTLPGIMIILFLIFIGFMLIRKQPILSFGILFFFLNHLTESSVICLELIFEHRNYLPSFFLFVPVALGIAWVLDFYRKKRVMYSILVTFFTLMLMGLGISTYVRNMAWKNDRLLWLDAMEKAPGSGRAVHNLAWGYYERIGEIDKALELYARALKLEGHSRHDNVVTLSNMSGIYIMKGQWENAITYAKKALDLFPGYEKGYFKLCSALSQLGRWDEALKYSNVLVSHLPGNVKYLTMKGFILLKKQKYPQSVNFFRKALQKNPNYKRALLNMGIALNATAHYDRALWFLKRAYSLDPGNSGVLLALIEVSLNAGRLRDSERYATRLIDITTPEKIESLLRQLSVAHVSVPVSREVVAPVIAEKIRARSDKTADIAERLNNPNK